MTSILEKSKILSSWLRHRPDAIGLTLDRQGWADVTELLAKAAAAGIPITSAELQQLVIENDKQRFSLSADGLRIRAAQGHSIAVDLKLPVKTPPAIMYHGTVRKYLTAIRKQGLLPGFRRDVHLSATKETALAVGARRGGRLPHNFAVYFGRIRFISSKFGATLSAKLGVNYHGSYLLRCHRQHVRVQKEPGGCPARSKQQACSRAEPQ